MRRIGMRAIAAIAFAASIMLASCKYDTGLEDSRKNEQNEETGTVWDNWASHNGYIDTDGAKKGFISTMIYGTQTLPGTPEELPEFYKEGQYDSISLDKYETEYKAKLGLGDRYFAEETVYELDAAKRYMNEEDTETVFVCYFKYYSDKDYKNEIASVNVADEDVAVYAYAFVETKNFSTLIKEAKLKQ